MQNWQRADAYINEGDIGFARVLYQDLKLPSFIEAIEFQRCFKLLCDLRKNPTSEVHQMGQNLIAIQLVVEDMPFVMKSVLAMLEKQQLEVCFGAEATDSCNLVIQVIIRTDLSIIQMLQQELTVVIECIKAVCRDWLPMKEVIRDAKDDLSEEFITWLLDGNFIFLGVLGKGKKLGLWSTPQYTITPAIHQLIESNKPFHRTNIKSLVHRNVYMDAIRIKTSNGNRLILGLFASAVYNQRVEQLPVLKQKIEKVLCSMSLSGHDYAAKEALTLLQSYPRLELLQISEPELQSIIRQVIPLTITPKLTVLLRLDDSGLFAHILIFLPKHKFSTELQKKIETLLQTKLGGDISRRYISISDLKLAQLQFVILLESQAAMHFSLADIEMEIHALVDGWQDRLVSLLAAIQNQNKLQKSVEAFEEKYRLDFSPQEALCDLRLLEGITDHGELCRFHLNENGLGRFKFYSSKPILFSELCPILDCLGFQIVDNSTYKWNQVKIYSCNLKTKFQIKCLESVEEHLTLVFHNIRKKLIDPDLFNELILHNGITPKESHLLRILHSYTKQLGAALVDAVSVFKINPEATAAILRMLRLKFSHNVCSEELSKAQVEIQNLISNVSSYNEDKVLRCYLDLILAMNRTNFFTDPETVAFKFDTSKLSWAPPPKPWAEIFVYSSKVEGVHLRAGKVARGGIRWSERRDDYRTEILGLMKTQVTKNAVIVPTGAKGGFIVKGNTPVLDSYKEFLSGLLSLTDNVIDEKLYQPVLCYDNPDPYLVVAADKGTAGFSDEANKISSQYNFWLQDAFASGGSNGYSHKKIGITAKGVWVAIKEHFTKIHIDPHSDVFTVVGIGDMSGDVFGNGLLLSNKIKLIAAFNHKHIFIDPDPNPGVSFLERQRLFDKPSSEWGDYDKTLISDGGGVWLRDIKRISVTPQMQEALGLSKDIAEIDPNSLIKKILTAPVDLLWNGGIGTYVKSQNESDVQDKSNDLVRVNGKDLQCKVVGEGGNLGFTQAGRIEYALHGGLINTDFIDNSAGVDCSDHEVNLKIALHGIDPIERSKMLSMATDEIVKLVLADNYKQSRILSLEVHNNVQLHNNFIASLEKKHGFDRGLEGIRKDTTTHLTRPELATLLAYAKNTALQYLDGFVLENCKYYHQVLLQYFPQSVHAVLLSSNLDSHQLANEIVRTSLVNDFVNTLGIWFFQACIDHFADGNSIIKAFIIAKYGMQIDKVWQLLEEQDANSLELFPILQSIMKDAILWLLFDPHSCLNEDLDAILAKCHEAMRLFELSESTTKEKTSMEKSVELGNFLPFLQISGDLNIDIVKVYQTYTDSCNYFNLSQLLSTAFDFNLSEHVTAHQVKRSMTIYALQQRICNASENLVSAIRQIAMEGTDRIASLVMILKYLAKVFK